MVCVELADGGGGFFVGDADGGEGIFYFGELVMEDFEDADEIAGIADVHGVRERGAGGGGFIIAGLQILGNDVIGIAGRDEMFYGKAGAMGQEAGADVAEIAAGDADDGRVGLIGP